MMKVNPKIKNSIEEWRSEYKNGQPHWMRDKEPSKFVKMFSKELKEQDIKKGNILEIGCGNGRDSKYLAGQGYKVIGIDAVPEAIKEIPKGEDENPMFMTMNAEKLEFPSNKFEAVYTLAAIHSANLDKVFSETERVLKNKGILFALLYIDPNDNLPKGSEKIKHESLDKIFKYIEESGLDLNDFYADISDDNKEHSSLILYCQKLEG